MNNILSIAKDYLLNSDSEIDFFQTLAYLNSIGYELSEYETNELYKMVSDIALEISMVRSLHSWWMVKQHNKLCYGI